MQETRLMTWLDVKSLSHSHDEGTQQVDGHDVPGFGLVEQRLYDIPLDQAENDERANLLGLFDHPSDFRNGTSIPEDAKAPSIPKLDHRRAHRRASRITGAIGNDENGHVIGSGHHWTKGSGANPVRVPKASIRPYSLVRTRSKREAWPFWN